MLEGTIVHVTYLIGWLWWIILVEIHYCRPPPLIFPSAYFFHSSTGAPPILKSFSALKTRDKAIHPSLRHRPKPTLRLTKSQTHSSKFQPNNHKHVQRAIPSPHRQWQPSPRRIAQLRCRASHGDALPLRRLRDSRASRKGPAYPLRFLRCSCPLQRTDKENGPVRSAVIDLSTDLVLSSVFSIQWNFCKGDLGYNSDADEYPTVNISLIDNQ